VYYIAKDGLRPVSDDDGRLVVYRDHAAARRDCGFVDTVAGPETPERLREIAARYGLVYEPPKPLPGGEPLQLVLM